MDEGVERSWDEPRLKGDKELWDCWEVTFERLGWQVWRGLWKRKAGAAVSGSSCLLQGLGWGVWGPAVMLSPAPSFPTGIGTEGPGDRWPLSLFLAGH